MDMAVYILRQYDDVETLRAAERIHQDLEVTYFFCFGNLSTWVLLSKRMGEIDSDVNHRIQAGWLKWRSAT